MQHTLLVAAALLCLMAGGCGGNRPTDFQLELQQWNQQIAAAERTQQTSPADVRLSWQLIYLRYSRAALTGDPEEFARLYASLLHSAPAVTEPVEMQQLLAKLEFQLHRFPQARARLAGLPQDPEDRELRAMTADLALLQGHSQQACDDYRQLLQEQSETPWDQLARYAHLRATLGERVQAEQLYARASELLTVKQMRYYAWLQVQRGELAMRYGQLARARQHYERADRAYSGYWLVADHLAELTAAEGNLQGAIQRYQRIVRQWPRPDFQRALGDVYLQAGDAEQARQWHQRALAGYLASVQRGEVHYLHHLADFYADVNRDGAAAVTWAEKDLQLRQNFSAEDMLGWALYRDGRFLEALTHSKAALTAAGNNDSHVLRHAALIHAAAGQGSTGTELLQRATAINPAADTFHVHR